LIFSIAYPRAFDSAQSAIARPLAMLGPKGESFFASALIACKVHRLSRFSRHYRPDENQLNSNYFSIQNIGMPTSANLRPLAPARRSIWSKYA
jgi:hypothetical protein